MFTIFELHSSDQKQINTMSKIKEQIPKTKMKNRLGNKTFLNTRM